MGRAAVEEGEVEVGDGTCGNEARKAGHVMDCSVMGGAVAVIDSEKSTEGTDARPSWSAAVAFCYRGATPLLYLCCLAADAARCPRNSRRC